jgi:hypothetical protein
MQPPPDRIPAPAPTINAGDPAPRTRRTVLIVTAVIVALAIGMALHLTGIVGPG